MSGGNRDYVLLWNAIDRTFEDVKQRSIQDAAAWPGWPKDMIRPNPIDNTMNIRPFVPPQGPLGGRTSSRQTGGGYMGLANYNVLP